jgi:hypothetical protein
VIDSGLRVDPNPRVRGWSGGSLGLGRASVAGSWGRDLSRRCGDNRGNGFRLPYALVWRGRSGWSGARR